MASLVQNEIINIDKFSPKVKEAKIKLVDDLKQLNLGPDCRNLDKISIISNYQLLKINGFENVREGSTVELFDNSSITKKKLFDYLKILQVKKCNIVLDVLNYRDLIEFEKENGLVENVIFSEKVQYNERIDRSREEVKEIDEMICSTLEPYIDRNDSEEKIIATVIAWCMLNIVYDQNSFETKSHQLYKKGKEVGVLNGSNSIENAIKYGTVVCEGYAKFVQYVLKIYGIESVNTYVNTSFESQYPNHAIIKTDLRKFENNNSLIGTYYSDITKIVGLYQCGYSVKECSSHFLETREECETSYKIFDNRSDNEKKFEASVESYRKDSNNNQKNDYIDLLRYGLNKVMSTDLTLHGKLPELPSYLDKLYVFKQFRKAIGFDTALDYLNKVELEKMKLVFNKRLNYLYPIETRTKNMKIFSAYNAAINYGIDYYINKNELNNNLITSSEKGAINSPGDSYDEMMDELDNQYDSPKYYESSYDESITDSRYDRSEYLDDGYDEDSLGEDYQSIMSMLEQSEFRESVEGRRIK